MNQRPLGKTGMWVSEVGFGSWPIGDKGWGSLATDAEAVFLIHCAHDLGCNFFDTAPQFGQGRSETLLGKALKGERKLAIVCSKFGLDTNGKNIQSPEELAPSVEASLARLQTDYLDVLLLDDISYDKLDHDHPIFEGLEKLKQQGKIRAYGVSVDTHHEFLMALEKTPSQVIEVRFNVLHQECAPSFGQAARQGLGLVAKSPLDSGWLSGDYTAKSRFSGLRQRWNKEMKDRRAGLVKHLGFLAKPGTQLAQASLQYVLSYPEISCVVPGIKNAMQLDYAIGAASQTLDPKLTEKAEEVYFREIKGNPLSW